MEGAKNIHILQRVMNPSLFNPSILQSPKPATCAGFAVLAQHAMWGFESLNTIHGNVFPTQHKATLVHNTVSTLTKFLLALIAVQLGHLLDEALSLGLSLRVWRYSSGLRFQSVIVTRTPGP